MYFKFIAGFYYVRHNRKCIFICIKLLLFWELEHIKNIKWQIIYSYRPKKKKFWHFWHKSCILLGQQIKWNPTLMLLLSCLLDKTSDNLSKLISQEAKTAVIYTKVGLMLKLKLQYFGHLIQRADSSEKTLMLGKIEGGRRRGQQSEMVEWHHWLNGHELE